MTKTIQMWVDKDFKRMCENITHNLNEACKPGKPKYKPVDVTRLMTGLGIALEMPGYGNGKRKRKF